MGWAAIISAILSIFGPIIADWLRSLFDDSAGRLGAFDDARAESEIDRLFAEAERELGWLQVPRRMKLRWAKRVAKKRAPQIVAAARAHAALTAIPPLTEDELSQLADLNDLPAVAAAPPA